MQHKFTALLTVLLIGSTMSLSSKSKLSPFESGLLPENSIMKRLNNVFVQLKSIDDSTSNVKTFSAFQDVIYGLLRDLESDQKKHEEVLDEMNKQCAEEDSFRKKEVADAVQAVGDASASKNVCSDKLATAQKLLVEAQNILADEKAKKEERTKIREQEHKIYESEKAQYEDAIAFLREFIGMVHDRLNPASAQTSFIQFSEKLLRHTAGLKRLDAAVPVLVMLAQYTSAAAGDYKEFNGSETAKTLQEKLDTLLKTLEDDLATIIKVEEDRVADFQAFLAKVNQNIAELEATIADLGNQITKMEECVAREDAIIAEANAKRVRNDDLGQKAASMCKKFAEEVAEATKARRTELQVVQEILNLLAIRFGTVPARMTEYMKSIEEKFAEYENRTKFILVKYYERADLVENAHGKDIVADTQAYVDNQKF